MTDANASKNGLDKVVKGLKANVFDLLSELVIISPGNMILLF